ncbi:ADP-forming succinate--CoA ligase subunit beta [Candidatus Schneideria nysicola]|uniref:ADP-forming succinate--CoA ligase subunit beta n=1 Tax=Candidatus Schneideria nysicola TaxID=1081631 RepID=UPI001CAA6C1B|nr:ADP-forming succinate--CoA ligase subunit beta [Candidatus Schneideria nysicola]UAJ66146.1 ADP-forming succinate--CoA ligase subunit beta [Candidatus Schneideria nysicola]
MNLHEYQAKSLLAEFGLAIPRGCVCTTLSEIEQSTFTIGPAPWVLKCQVHAGGRGKYGGVAVVQSRKEVSIFADKWFNKRLVTNQTDSHGQLVSKILIEQFTPIYQSLYLGVIIDSKLSRIVFMASSQGGIEIEETVKESPNLIYKIILDPLIGPQPYQGRQLGFEIGLSGKQVTMFSEYYMRLAKLFIKYDLSLAEINPLVITNTGDLICLDGKMVVDSNALFRQITLKNMKDDSQEDPRQAQAVKWNLNYVPLDGNIGCMVNGAGLAMATMDMINLCGGKPANFLDVGGNANKEQITEACKILLSDNTVQAILINIFGGIVRCDIIAEGIIDAVNKMGVNIPIIVRLEGNHAKLGEEYFTHSGLNVINATSLMDAAKKSVFVVQEKK